jgi:phospholipid/cholesterol/gamma-HCH transport system permease protein
MTDTARKAEFTLRPQTAGTLVVQLDGDWRFENHPPACEQLVNTLEAQTTRPSRLRLQGDGLGDWDSALIIFLLGLQQHGKNTGLEIDYNPLPQGLQRLVALATAVPKRRQPRRRLLGIPILTKVGNLTIELHQTWRDSLGFIGEASISFANLLRGRIRFRRTDLTTLLEQCGAQALPIVTLISLLVGMILAFVGAVQLRLFGAEIFVANLVALGMAREMGAMMTGIIMAGRTGAAFAAQIGTMQVNEEIDALQTMGIPPIDFLVLPRILALVLMMPFLCIYADFMGILGGALVSVTMLDISFFEYFTQARSFVGLDHFFVGIVKASVFGVLVALAGCLRGIQCGRSASSVGFAATSAVVTSIVWIVVADALITIVCEVLKI